MDKLPIDRKDFDYDTAILNLLIELAANNYAILDLIVDMKKQYEGMTDEGAKLFYKAFAENRDMHRIKTMSIILQLFHKE